MAKLDSNGIIRFDPAKEGDDHAVIYSGRLKTPPHKPLEIAYAEPKGFWRHVRRRLRFYMVKWGWMKMTRNPMLDYPRNLACWCGSERKAKVCCLPKQPRTVPTEIAALFEKYMIHVRLADAGQHS